MREREFSRCLSLSLFLSPSHKEIRNGLMFVEPQLETGNWSTTVPNNGFRIYMCVCEYIYTCTYVETATHSIINRIGGTVCCVSDRISSINFDRDASFFPMKKKIWCYIRSLAKFLPR